MTRKILIVGPAWVGDMVMAQSLFKLLKLQDEAIEIDVLAPSWTNPLLKCMPQVSHAIELPFSHGELKLGERAQLAKKLRQKKYDQAIILQNSLKSALIPWLARIPIRTGWRGEARYFLINDMRVLDKKKYPRMIEQFMALGLPANSALPKTYPYPRFYVNEESQHRALATYQPLRRGKPILALGAGAEFGPSKRWPVAYFAEVANQKIAQGWDVWLFGSPKDKMLTDQIMKLTDERCENLAGRMPLTDTIVMLSLTQGLVTNDSGLMHLAAALEKPLIAIYGSTSPAFTPPLSNHAKILRENLSCQPCFKRECPLGHHACMQNIKPSNVLEALKTWSD